jgi:KamA family protein
MSVATGSIEYRPVNLQNVADVPHWWRLKRDEREAIEVVGRVFAFRTNRYVIEELIDWDAVPDDPMFQLTFPQREMLEPDDYERIRSLLRGGAHQQVEHVAREIRMQMHPHPGGQETYNVPESGGEKLRGVQHKYRETVLYFPAAGQTCHAYCTYCFRWAQFTEVPGHVRFAGTEVSRLVEYLHRHPEVTDVLVTGGDPMVMRARKLAELLEPLADQSLRSITTVRIGTKALAFWPQRFVTARDADEVLRVFERLVARGIHVAVMAHVTHPRELLTDAAQVAIRRVLATGAQIRMQAPIIKHVNDSIEAWAQMWSRGVALGLIPYYVFVARDTGPRYYFQVPLARAHVIVKGAQQQVSGLARTARGPVMSTFHGKIHVVGSAEICGEHVFVLQFLQAREPEQVNAPFFASYDEEATWIDELRPAFGQPAVIPEPFAA